MKKKVDQLGDRVEDKKSQAMASEEAELKKKEALLQQMHHEVVWKFGHFSYVP